MIGRPAGPRIPLVSGIQLPVPEAIPGAFASSRSGWLPTGINTSRVPADGRRRASF